MFHLALLHSGKHHGCGRDRQLRSVSRVSGQLMHYKLCCCRYRFFVTSSTLFDILYRDSATRAVLFRRRYLAVKQLDEDANTVRKFQRQSKYEVGSAEWNPCDLNSHLCAISVSMTLFLFFCRQFSRVSLRDCGIILLIILL